MAQPTVELAAELTVTDAASKTLSSIQSGVRNVAKQFDKASSSAMSFAKSTLSTALGVKLAGVGDMVSNAMNKAFDAAKSLGKEQKEVAAALLMTDKSGASYETIKKHAAGLHGELRNMGIAAGVSGSEVVGAYADIAARTTKSEADLKRVMKSMVDASRALPGGLASLTTGFEMMEMGMIRARNPVVQLVASSGLLKGNAREVAKEMQKMKPEDALALGEKAIERMAAKMRNVPLGYGQAIKSMKDIQKSFYESMGTGILKAMSPVMRTFRDEFFKHQGDIANFADKVGKSIYEASKDGVVKLKEAFAWLDSHWDQIANGFKKAADALFTAVKFVVDNKELIAGAFGAYKGVQLGSAGIGAVKDVGGAFVKMGAAEGNKLKGLGVGVTGAEAAGGIAAFLATAAAVVSLGLAVDQATKLYDETVGVEMRSRQAVIDRLNEENAAREKLLVDMRKRDEAQQRLLELGYKMAQAQATPEKFDLTQQNAMDFASMAKKGYTVGSSGENIGTTYTEGAAMVTEFTAAFKAAQESHNQTTINQALRMLQSSSTLQLALVQSGLNVEGGFEALLEAAEKGGSEFGKMAKGLKALLGNGKLNPGKMGVNIGGGNTFNIKQEFREGDPDRVLTVFKGGIAKAALSRLNARVSTPFGGF